ncbi:beta-chimaerin [Coccidioides immitis H538.4]|uniref:Beta-chimaerin n=1 Tax=Coccidioides immitis H538.4 TaxID=396776 RepID=A0A0J8RQB9_COCIT|nr:beta-chimaerin [Coccidioides immitis H538.4]
MQHPPKRGDSLESKLHHTLPRKGIESTKSNHAHSKTDKDSVTGVDGNKSDGKTARKPDLKPSVDDSTPVASPRPHTSGNSTLKDQASTPQSLDRRLNHDRNESLSALQSTSRRAESSPSLPRYSAGGDFSLEEDMARIMGDENQNHESFLRRVSNSVRHGRSFSEKGSRLSKELKWPKSPSTGSTFAQDISSPSTSSPEAREELNWFKNELRRERQKIIEKDQKIAELEAALNATANIKEVNTELREKRSTMVFLDAQKEIVLRELEVLREHIATEKQSNAPLDLGKVSNAVLRDLAEALRRLKESFMPQIEELIQKRNDLVEELGNLGRMKDKSFQEFEQLSLKNAQLAELNNQLVHQIQELYKANSNSTDSNRQAPNGLGIYHHKDKSTASVERDLRSITNEPSPGIVQPEEAEPITVVQGPQVKRPHMEAFLPTSDNNSGPQRAQTQDPSRQGFGFFGNQKTKTSQWKPPANGSSSVLNEGSIGLFGSDLEQRLEVERGVIPSIVTRCIEEVELRGMDVEGIYRKSGGSSQVQMVRDGFERSRDFDISDPDLDIHAVTSALKQYFRMLPTPLITYDVYDMLLDANNITPASSRIDVMQHGLQELPRVHRDVLEFLVFHLKRVVDRERENLMTSLNIAVVFAPTIMRPESLSREMTDVQKKNETLQFLVDNCQDIFMGMPE